jgi:hypothetical protein
MTATIDHVYARLNGTMWFLAAQKLFDGNDIPSMTGLPGYFCATHAFEVLMKAALAKAGAREQDLRSGFGHSLGKLCDELQMRGFEISAEVEKLLHHLSDRHMKHVVRYSLLKPQEDFPAVPWSYLQATYDELLMLTHPSRFPTNIPTNFSNR